MFEIFDPVGLFSLPHWGVIVIGVLLIPCSIWVSRGRILIRFQKVISSLKSEREIQSKFPKWGLVVIRLFLIIILNNMGGLFSWVYTSTSHIRMTIRLAFPLWIGWLLNSFVKDWREVIASFTLSGVNIILALFLSILETLRLIIRPLTLRIRLAANLVAGHLILRLVSRAILSLGVGAVVGRVGIFVLLFLELAVSLIQAYVFTTLLILYFR